jgi:hypothetical protein
MPVNLESRMKKHPLFALSLLAVVSIWGCESTNSISGNSNDSLLAKPDTVTIHTADQECADLKPGQFCAFGLDFLKLGDSLTWNEHIRPTLADGIMKDTVFTEVSQLQEGGDSVSWFAKILRMPDGDIILDADFEQGQFLGRVRIESGRYHHSSGLRVGSTGKELKAFTTEAYVVPFEAYHIMEVIVPYQNSKIIFHFPEAGIFSKDKAEYTMADIPDDAKVIRIVLM